MGRQPANTKIGEKKITRIRVRGGNFKFRALRLDHGNYSWAGEAVTRKTRILKVVYNSTNNELVRTNTLVKGSIILIDSTPFKAWYLQYYNIDLSNKKEIQNAIDKRITKDTKDTKEEEKGGKEKGGKKEEKGGKKEEKGKETKKTAEKPKKEEKGQAKKQEPKAKAEEKAEKPKKEEKAPAKKPEEKTTKKETPGELKKSTKKEKGKPTSAKGKQKVQEDKSKKDLSKKAIEKFAKRNSQRLLEPNLGDQFKTGRLYAKISSRPGQSGRCDGYILEGEELAFYLKKINLKKKK
jgi:ribosomal protein eS8